MSHITTIKDVLVKDLDALNKAVKRLTSARLEVHEEKPVRLYQKEPVLAVAQVQLSGWTYPVLVKKNGELAYDNYGGQWGSISELNKLKQAYGVEKAKQLARTQGYTCTERQKQDGTILLEMTR